MARWLLIDSCGPEASLALGEGELVAAQEVVPGRSFSAAWPGALRGLLEHVGWGVHALHVVGVVGGPGSFTGVRVGLAVAKGLCEAWKIPLVALSRLEVLAELGVAGSVAVLDAGRNEFYVREGAGEKVVGKEALLALALDADVVTTDQRVVDALAGVGRVEKASMEAASAVPLLLRRVEAEDFSDLGSVDANYVRGEGEMYAAKGTSLC